VSFHCLKTKHSMGQFSGYQVQKQWKKSLQVTWKYWGEKMCPRKNINMAFNILLNIGKLLLVSIFKNMSMSNK
jgi:hypothetical protein